MNPVHDMLIGAAVRRCNDAAFLHGLETTDARNRVLRVGPGPDAVTNAVMVRQSSPDTPELNEALARLARFTHKQY